jgi:hypothetical protein
MSTEIVVTIALFVNVGALIFVGWQTLLTRQSVKLAEHNTKEAQRAKELFDLPKAHLVISVRMQLEEWRADLQTLINDKQYIITQIKANDTSLGSKYGIESPNGLADKRLYEFLPSWLQIILITAAQYYYDCKAPAIYLSPNEKGTEFPLSILSGILERAEIGVGRITELLSYIDKTIPDWYLECPASIDEKDFMSK